MVVYVYKGKPILREEIFAMVRQIEKTEAGYNTGWGGYSMQRAKRNIQVAIQFLHEAGHDIHYGGSWLK